MLIKHQIYINLLLLALLPLILISVLTEEVAYKALKDVINSGYHSLSEEKAEAIGRLLDNHIHEVRLLANHPQVIDAVKNSNRYYSNIDAQQRKEDITRIDKQWIEKKGYTAEAKQIISNSLSQLLKNIQGQQTEIYGEIFVTNRFGATVAMTKILSDYYQADEYWWQEGSAFTQEGAFLDDRGFDESVGAIVIGMTVPVMDMGNFIGVLKINYRAKAILDIVSGKGLEQGYNLVLVRSDGTVISSKDDTYIEGLYEPILTAIITGDHEMKEVVVKKKELLIAAHPMKHVFKTRQKEGGVSGVRGETTEQKTWYIVYEVDKNHAFAPLEQLTRNALLLALCAIILVALVGYLLTRSINRPLTALKKGVDTIGGGDLGYRIDLRVNNELGRLAQAFNEMAQALQHSVATREELNREIEERTLAQEELGRFKSTLDQTMDCVFMFDPQTLKFFYVNQGAMSQIGYSIDELREMTPLDIKPEYNEKGFRIITNSMIQGPEHRITFTTVHRHKDGHDIPVEVFLQYIAPVDTPPRFVAVVRDITERRRAEEEKEQLQRYLNELLNAMPSIVVAVDPEGQVTHWNRQAVMVTGISSEEAIGHPVGDLLNVIKSHYQQVHAAIVSGRQFELERLSYQYGDDLLYANVLIYPLTATGIKGAVIRVDDVTEKTHMEEMMVQTEKMLSVGGLAGGMAHELNNPIGGMVQGIQNIRRRFSRDLDKNIEAAKKVGVDLEKMQQYLDEREISKILDLISQSGVRASNIVNNMLRFSRKSETAIQAVDLKTLILETVELAAVDYDLKKKYDFRSIDIEYEYQPDLPPLNCIPGEIQQVLLNLLRNSAQALSEQTDRAEAAHIILRASYRDDWFRIEIEDNGPGMAPEIRKRAFEPFFTTKPTGQGTGLGLSVSYYIIHEEHHGSITLDTELGKGVKFIIGLPAAHRREGDSLGK